MPRPAIRYALPTSCLRVAGTITELHDTVLDETTAVPSTTVALHVHGLKRDQTLEVLTGTFRDTSVSLEMSEDGRLSSADSESSGQLGHVIIGAVGAGAAVASAALGLLPAAAALGGVVHGGARREVALAYLPVPVTAADPVGAAYSEQHPELANLRQRYSSLVDRSLARIATLAEHAPDASVTAGELGQIRREQELLAVLRAELQRLDVHFESWRAATIQTHVVKQERCFSLDILRGAGIEVADGEVKFARDADDSIRFVWQRLGIAIVMDPAGIANPTPPTSRQNGVVVRFPRRTRLSVYERVNGKAVLRSQRPYLVVDAACETAVVALRRSLWAKRSTGLTFGKLGVVTGYSLASTSSAGAVADSASQLPQSVSDGLEQGTKLDEQITTLGAPASDGTR